MGCCWSNEDDKYGQSEPDETTGLLRNPVGTTQTRPIIGDGLYNPQAAQVPLKGDEQSALSRILHQTASNVIDVAAIDSQQLEHHDYHDRSRQYSNRINMVLNRTGQPKTYKTSLPNGISAPQSVLAAQPISLADVQLITSAAERASKALKDVKVVHKEELVVPFGDP
ncbi:ragulator complex protein LAMTOR1-like [Liolophura sinensis]|uniref:ragulator complex protein LAMTOR1-like n=1 Tax=Liolophura sinensis TaxID=3198878 RepID=UPI003158E6FC